MKKLVFVAAMAVCATMVMWATPASELGYDFPLDEGGIKLMAAFIALIASLAGAVVSIRKALVVLFFTAIAMVYFFSPLTFLAFGAMFALARVMVDGNSEIKEFILTPFKPEEES